MPLTIGDQRFFTATEVAKDLGVVRQTLWRWRQERKIPAGRRYRDRQVVFTEAELTAIREFAHRIAPLAGDDTPDQLKLFESF